MKEIIIAILAFTTRAAFSSPAIRSGRFRNARLDGGDSYNPTPSNPDSDSNVDQSAPYPPRGWAPSGDLLLVPGETHSSQQNGYGPPPPAAPPTSQYGPADSTTERTTTATPEPPSEEPDASEGSSQLQSPLRPGENGQYYVLLPDGKLQRVQYSGKQRGRGQYEAQVQYEEIEPVRPPVFSYQNFPLPLPL